MADLNDFIPVDDVDDVLAQWVGDLIASSLRSEYKNTETLSGTRTLLDADTPIQLFDCDGSDRIAKMPTEDAVNNHPYWIGNSTASGNYTLTLQNNAGSVNLCVLLPGQFVLCLPDGAGEYKTISDGGGVIVANVTTANVSAAEGLFYVLDISGLTANRDFNLPTPSAAGKPIKIKITTGDDTYALIVKKNSTEITRLFITGEVLEFVSTGTGAGDWVVSQDGRIPCLGYMDRVTTDGNTTHAASTPTLADWNNAPASNNRGNMESTANDRFTARRAGFLNATSSYKPATGLNDQQFARVQIRKNGTAVATGGARQSSTVASALAIALVPRTRIPVVAGDYIDTTFETQEADRGLGRSDATSFEGQSSFQVEEVLIAI